MKSMKIFSKPPGSLDRIYLHEEGSPLNDVHNCTLNPDTYVTCINSMLVYHLGLRGKPSVKNLNRTQVSI